MPGPLFDSPGIRKGFMTGAAGRLVAGARGPLLPTMGKLRWMPPWEAHGRLLDAQLDGETLSARTVDFVSGMDTYVSDTARITPMEGEYPESVMSALSDTYNEKFAQDSYGLFDFEKYRTMDLRKAIAENPFQMDDTPETVSVWNGDEAGILGGSYAAEVSTDKSSPRAIVRFTHQDRLAVPVGFPLIAPSKKVAVDLDLTFRDTVIRGSLNGVIPAYELLLPVFVKGIDMPAFDNTVAQTPKFIPTRLAETELLFESSIVGNSRDDWVSKASCSLSFTVPPSRLVLIVFDIGTFLRTLFASHAPLCTVTETTAHAAADMSFGGTVRNFRFA